MSNEQQCCTAIVIQAYSSCLSDNYQAFWCSLDNYGIGAKIGKQTPEGQKIGRGIQNNISLLQMERLIMALALPYITTHQFEQIIRQTEQDAFTRGKNAVREQLAKVLEIE